MSPSFAKPLLQAAEVAGRSVGHDLVTRGDGLVHALTGRRIHRAPAVRWTVHDVDLGGRNFRFRSTDGPIGATWAINVHGYFAGGSMYARESEALAERLGWRLVNPSLPGFGGSDPLPDATVALETLSDHLDIVRDRLGIDRFVLLGHSMGGAVAIDYAARHRADTLGVIYRDGVATPDWQVRHGWPARLFEPVLPEFAPVVDLVSAVAIDASDLLVGHAISTVAALLPELRANARTVGAAAPVARMLLRLDLTETVRQLAATDVPIYPVWGCFDRVVTTPAAASFAVAANTEVQWVPGGHLWMLARPRGQADLLTVTPSGRAFMDEVRVRALR